MAKGKSKRQREQELEDRFLAIAEKAMEQLTRPETLPYVASMLAGAAAAYPTLLEATSAELRGMTPTEPGYWAITFKIHSAFHSLTHLDLKLPGPLLGGSASLGMPDTRTVFEPAQWWSMADPFGQAKEQARAITAARMKLIFLITASGAGMGPLVMWLAQGTARALSLTLMRQDYTPTP